MGMPFVTEERTLQRTETWNVAVCDQCGERRDLGPAWPGAGPPRLPVSWFSVHDDVKHPALLTFCSLDCLKQYH